MISVSDVNKIDIIKKQIKKEIYTKIYEQFSKKIKFAAERGRKDIFLRTPGLIMGYPTFDRFMATKYVERQLRLSGFTTQLVSDYDIYVSWMIDTRARVKETRESDTDEFPSLINLKKVAAKYKRGA